MRLYYADEDANIYILHGDTLEAATLPSGALGAKCLWTQVRVRVPAATRRPDLLVADPPYGTASDNDFTRFSHPGDNIIFPEGQRTWNMIQGDAEPFDPTWLPGLARRTIVWGANKYHTPLPQPAAYLLWLKKTHMQSRSFLSDAEIAWMGDTTQEISGVWVYHHPWQGFNRASERGVAYHPHQKPVKLMVWCLETANARGMVFDPFMGAGPTLLAAKRLGLPAVGIEIEETFCQTAAERLEAETLPLMPRVTNVQPGLWPDDEDY